MRRNQVSRRVVRCPLCLKGRLIDLAVTADPSKLTLYGPQQSNQAQMFLKCHKCGQQIGLSIRAL